jgi:hypothetical protein
MSAGSVQVAICALLWSPLDGGGALSALLSVIMTISV